MLGCQRLGIAESRTTDRKRRVTFVEIDRNATDATGGIFCQSCAHPDARYYRALD